MQKGEGNLPQKTQVLIQSLGPTFFDAGNMDTIVKEVKDKFSNGKLNYKESLEILAEELGVQLKEATQAQLKKGIENLLGKAMMAVTFYEEKVSYCKEHSKINSNVTVYVKTTPNQNKLTWDNGKDAIDLRVKFSRGHEHGWSSVKLTSEYQIK